MSENLTDVIVIYICIIMVLMTVIADKRILIPQIDDLTVIFYGLFLFDVIAVEYGSFAFYTDRIFKFGYQVERKLCSECTFKPGDEGFISRKRGDVDLIRLFDQIVRCTVRGVSAFRSFRGLTVREITLKR